MYSRFYNAVGDILQSSLPSLTCRRGPVPAEGDEGTIYYDVAGMTQKEKEEDAKISVRYVYFPDHKPCAVDDGLLIASAVSTLEYRGNRLDAEKMEFKTHGKHVEVTIVYGVDDPGALSIGKSKVAVRMKTITLSVNVA